jgi:probable Rubsico expression protein CbbX
MQKQFGDKNKELYKRTSGDKGGEEQFGFMGKAITQKGDDEGHNKNEAANYRKLSDRLKEASAEEKKASEAAYARDNANKIKRREKARKIELMKEIPDDTPAGNPADFMFKQGVQQVLDNLDAELIGLTEVKEQVRQIAALLVVDKMRMKLGLETTSPSLHMSFTGSPGTGKTTVALKMGEILQRMGYSRRGHVVVATRDDLVGQYVGHTAPKTKEIIKQAFGGILLIDEAYYLYNAENHKDYGQESLEVILSIMENNKDDLVVIFAGYADLMERFYSFVPGLLGRIGNRIDFPDYGGDELLQIARVMFKDNYYHMEPGAEANLLQYLERRRAAPFFANARTVRNAMNDARMKAATRIFEEKMLLESDGIVTNEELMTIKAEDIPTLEELEEELSRMTEAAVEESHYHRDEVPGGR